MNQVFRRVDGFMYTTAIKRLRKMRKRIRVVPGGASAGKTYGIIPILIDKAAKKSGLVISIVSETMPHLRKGAMKDFIAIMQATNRWNPKCWHATDRKYTFFHPNNKISYIEFFSADDEDRVRGPRRNILYVNECNNIKFATYYNMMIRTDQEIWLDYNPTAEFWVDTEVLTDTEDTELLRLTYRDNEALSETIVKEMLKNREKAKTSKYWENWCRVYLDGMIGMLEGVIFQDWEQCDDIPKDAKLLGYGIDFGFSNDPTALVAVYLYNGNYYFDQIIYQVGLKSRDLAALMKSANVNKKVVIYGDPSASKTIAEIAEYGYSILPAKGGPGSIIHGIDIMQGVRMYITKRSTDIIKELRTYMWLTDKTGKTLNEPVDAFNHSLDAMRYFALMRISKRAARRPKVTYR